MDLDNMTGEDAQLILHNLKMAIHCAFNHPPCRVIETANDEWLIQCCGLGCPIHFCMILREKPLGQIDNWYLFCNFFAALWEPETSMCFGPNGMEIHTAAGSGSIVMGGLHG